MSKLPDIFAFASGKGGVGKTSICVNLAVEVSQRGYNVVLIDTDLGGSNIELCLNMKCEKNLDDFFSQKRKKDIVSLITPTRYRNLGIIAGTSVTPETANPYYQQKMTLIKHIQKIKADVIIMDLGAGVDLDTLDLFLSANRKCIVTDDNLTSMKNANDFIKACLYRSILRTYKENGIIERLLKQTPSINILFGKITNSDITEDEKTMILDAIKAITIMFRPILIANRVKEGLASTINRVFVEKNFLDMHVYLDILAEDITQTTYSNNLLDYLDERESDDLKKYLRYIKCIESLKKSNNYVYEDTNVKKAIKKSIPFIIGSPRAKASRSIRLIADALGYHPKHI